MTEKPLLLTSNTNTDRMLAQMRESWTVEFFEDIDDMDDFVAKRGAEVRAMTPKIHTRIDGTFMDMFPNLGMISNYGVGYDSIDADAAAARAIVVSHTPDVLNDEVANSAIMLMLAVHRDIVTQDAYVRAGKWVSEGTAPLTRGIAGQKVGIVGMGRIGQATAEKLGVFGVDISYHTRTPKDIPWEYVGDLVELAAAVDTLIVIVPGGPATDKIINEDVLNALGPRGVLVNVARGTVVDEAALVSALQDGRLGGAGLDVFENEPHVPEELFGMENVVLLPHVGSATVETRQAMGDLVCDNLDQWLKTGKAVRPVPECQHL